MELSLLRTFALGSEIWNFRSLELSFRSLELSLPGAKFQELSLPETFDPWNIRSQE